MTRHPLARIVDPDSLDRAVGPRARLRIEVPAEWLVAGGQVDLSVPCMLTCARCDGGGCDGCDRSGALRMPAAAVAQPLRLHLPLEQSGAIVRLNHPLPGSSLDQLLVEVRPAARPSRCVSMVAMVASVEDDGEVRRGALIAVLLLAGFAAMAAALLWAW